MFWITAIAFFTLSYRLSDRFKKNFSDTIGISTAIVIMTLYLLAFFRALKGIFFISAAYIIYAVADYFLNIRGKRKIGRLPVAEFVLPIVTIVVVGILVKDRIFTWWDDINFWSSDAKQLFFMNGFPGRYGNVSPEFGDYPPALSLFKWLFLQLSPSKYYEGLQFVGYFAANVLFIMPLMGMAGKLFDEMFVGRARTARVFMFLALVLLPGVFNGIIYYATPADITMAIIYGILLLAIYDRKGTDTFYYYMRIGLYVSVLLLTKSVGIEWGLFALAFYLLIGKREKWIWISAAMGGASIGSWLLFCFINRRVAKLTGAGIRMATSGTYRAPENTIDKMIYFFQGFLFMPMHGDHNITLDLSAGAAVLLIFLGLLALWSSKVLAGDEAVRIISFAAVTGLLAFGIVFLAHISIFQGEDQYLDAYAMAVSIARYCAPYTLGMTILTMGILLDRAKELKSPEPGMAACYLCIGIVLLTADYQGVYGHLWDYTHTIMEDETAYEDMVGDKGYELVEAVSNKELYGKRVLVFRDGHSYYWVHNAYLSKEASQVALVYDEFMAEEDSAESIKEKIRASHAEYFYVEDDEGLADELFSELLSGQEYRTGTVYSVSTIN
jgi:hypothetical protein